MREEAIFVAKIIAVKTPSQLQPRKTDDFDVLH